MTIQETTTTTTKTNFSITEKITETIFPETSTNENQEMAEIATSTSKDEKLEPTIETSSTESVQIEKPPNMTENDWNKSEIILLISSLAIGMLLIFLIIASAIKKQPRILTINQERRPSNEEIGIFQMREIGAEWRTVRNF